MSPTWDARKLLQTLRPPAVAGPVDRAIRQPPHAYGVWARGVFRPSAPMARFAAPILRRSSTAVRARFTAMIGGTTGSYNGENNLGLAVQFGDEGGDLVAINTALFPVKDPGDFQDFLLQVGGQQGQQPAPMLVFLDHHVGSIPATVAYGRSRARGRPASFAETTYHGAHSFWLAPVDGGTEVLVRYRWAPEAGDRALRSWAPPEADYPGHAASLGAELLARFADGPVRFTLMLEIGGADQHADDPSEFWPETLERLVAGELELEADRRRSSSADDVVFLPDHPPERWRPDPGDEVMKARGAVYRIARPR